MNEIKLQKCPFCGGSAHIIKKQGIYGGIAYQVICSHCKAAYPPHGTGLHIYYYGERNVFVTDRMAINDAIKQWNIRA